MSVGVTLSGFTRCTHTCNHNIEYLMNSHMLVVQFISDGLSYLLERVDTGPNLVQLLVLSVDYHLLKGARKGGRKGGREGGRESFEQSCAPQNTITACGL